MYCMYRKVVEWKIVKMFEVLMDICLNIYHVYLG